MPADNAKQLPMGQSQVKSPIPTSRKSSDSPELAVWYGAEICIDHVDQLVYQGFPKRVFRGLASLVAFQRHHDDQGGDFSTTNESICDFYRA